MAVIGYTVTNAAVIDEASITQLYMQYIIVQSPGMYLPKLI